MTCQENNSSVRLRHDDHTDECFTGSRRSYRDVPSCKRSAKDYGLEGNEALEYAYENVMDEARAGLRGIRMKKRPAPETAPAPAEPTAGAGKVWELSL